MKFARVLLFASLVVAVGCSGNSSDDDTTMTDRDAGPRDGGPPPDAGVRTECTIPENNPTCMMPADCSRPREPQAQCMTCPSDTESLCLAGQCVEPETVPPAGSHRYRVAIAGFENEVLSLVGLVVAAEMAGGVSITCDDAINRFSWDEWTSNTCFNVLRSQYRLITPPVAQVYTLSFSSFASGQKSLFLAYGFTDEDVATDPIGVTCTEFDVGPAGQVNVEIMGDNLQRIQ